MTVRTFLTSSYQKAVVIQKKITAAAAERFGDQFYAHEIDDDTLGKGIMYTRGPIITRQGAMIRVEADTFDWMPEIE